MAVTNSHHVKAVLNASVVGNISTEELHGGMAQQLDTRTSLLDAQFETISRINEEPDLPEL